MRSDFASADYTAGQLNAIVKILKKQAGENAPERFLRGELVVSEAVRVWCERDGVICFSVTSDGTDGEGRIARLEGKGFRMGKYAKKILRSPDFVPTCGVTYDIAVLKGELFADDDRTTAKVRKEAERRGMSAPNAEVACLIREKFSDADLTAMGLTWLVTMHEPIEDSAGGSRLLDANRDDGGRCLTAYHIRPDERCNRDGGFAFVAPQVGPYR
ncbi:MAG: hypothetical protein V1738_00620 [Patescibacteria group bacterium]